MYRFSIYNANADNLNQSSDPPGRTNLETDKPIFNGAWIDGLTWLRTQSENLSTGTYICVATSDTTVEPRGVWLFTVQEARAVRVAADFIGANVKAGA